MLSPDAAERGGILPAVFCRLALDPVIRSPKSNLSEQEARLLPEQLGTPPL